ncbi:MAG TPA: hypothetical protein ENK55_12440 [Actinobacteria bacterium]|nr:hypothetical protein [Actinomycetota bacterium]
MSDISRRQFLGTGVTAMAGGIIAATSIPHLAFAVGPEVSGILGVYRSAVRVGGRIYALITVQGADAVYLLEGHGTGRFEPTSPVEVDAPRGFFATSLAAHDGDLLVCGGRAEAWKSYDVDDALPPGLEAEFDRLPRNIPRGGRRRETVMGSVPHIVRISSGRSVQVSPASTAERAHEFVLGAGSDGHGLLLVLLGHTADLHESGEAVELEVGTGDAEVGKRMAIRGRLSHAAYASITVGFSDAAVVAEMDDGVPRIAQRSGGWETAVLGGATRGRHVAVLRDGEPAAIASIANGVVRIREFLDPERTMLGSTLYSREAIDVLPLSGDGSGVLIVDRHWTELVEV